MFLTEAELACFGKLFLGTAPVNRAHPGLPALLDRGWAVCGDDGVAALTKDGRDVATFSLGWNRHEAAAEPGTR